jgi:stress response protein SCP2
MVQFYFHIGNGKMVVLKDETGDRLADAADAMAQAAVIAKELADDDGQWRGYCVVVEGEHGAEIGRVPIAR